MQLFARKPDCSEIVLNTSPLDECTLVTANEHVQPWCQPVGHALGDQLAKAMDQAYWAVVFDFCWLRLLLKQHHIGAIEVAKTSPILCPEGIEHIEDVRFDDILGDFVEEASKAVRPWRFVVRHAHDHRTDFILREEYLEVTELKGR